jgi:UDP-glucose 4-epimerase|tara:strand:- start:1938 stop:2927 length:990 start_codon:yes stop_codon:yes gene_type:complete
MIKNILVTGGAGYIGSHTIEILIKNKINVFIADDLSTGFKKLINSKAQFNKVSILNSNKIKKIIIKNNIDSVIHLAAVLSVGESEKNPEKYNKINVTGTAKLLQALKNSKVKNIIFSSTCAVYKDGFAHVNENTKVKPTSVYGKTKLKCEKLIKKFCKKNKLNFGILRYFNVAGASASGKIGQINKGDQLFKNLSLEVEKKNPVFRIYGSDYKTKDGTCIRDYIHVSDIAEIHYKILKKIDKNKQSKILNCGYGKGISVNDTINEFKKYANKNLKIIKLPKRKGDMVKVISDNRKLKKFINWSPKYENLNKIVKSSIKWEKKNHSNEKI